MQLCSACFAVCSVVERERIEVPTTTRDLSAVTYHISPPQGFVRGITDPDPSSQSDAATDFSSLENKTQHKTIAVAAPSVMRKISMATCNRYREPFSMEKPGSSSARKWSLLPFQLRDELAD